MKTQHTQGKWFVIIYKQDNLDQWSNFIAVHSDDLGDYGEHIVKIICKELSEANAKLIAAAPDLLEALIEVKDALSPAFNFDFELKRNEHGYGYIDKMLKAIKKATE